MSFAMLSIPSSASSPNAFHLFPNFPPLAQGWGFGRVRIFALKSKVL